MAEFVARRTVAASRASGDAGSESLKILVSVMRNAQSTDRRFRQLKCNSPSFVRMKSLDGALEVLESAGFSYHENSKGNKILILPDEKLVSLASALASLEAEILSDDMGRSADSDVFPVEECTP